MAFLVVQKMVEAVGFCLQEYKGPYKVEPSMVTLKNILRKKKNYGNLNISPCKNIIFKKKSSKRNQNLSRHHNSIMNLIQHKPKYHLSKILILKKIDLLLLLLLLLLPRGAKIP
jgi:hypothetical protein